MRVIVRVVVRIIVGAVIGKICRLDGRTRLWRERRPRLAGGNGIDYRTYRLGFRHWRYYFAGQDPRGIVFRGGGTASRLEGEGGEDVVVLDGPRTPHNPAAIVAAPRVPDDRGWIDAVCASAIAGDRIERGRLTLALQSPDRRLARTVGNVLALGQHRPREPLDFIERHARESSHRIDRLTRSDPRLDIARTELTLELDFQLSQPRSVASDSRVQALIDLQHELFFAAIGEDQVRAVVAQSYQPELTHAAPPDTTTTHREPRKTQHQAATPYSPDVPWVTVVAFWPLSQP
jgi:hypothetical protein